MPVITGFYKKAQDPLPVNPEPLVTTGCRLPFDIEGFDPDYRIILSMDETEEIFEN